MTCLRTEEADELDSKLARFLQSSTVLTFATLFDILESLPATFVELELGVAQTFEELETCSTLLLVENGGNGGRLARLSSFTSSGWTRAAALEGARGLVEKGDKMGLELLLD